MPKDKTAEKGEHADGASDAPSLSEKKKEHPADGTRLSETGQCI